MSSTDNSIFPHTHSRTQWDIGISNWMFIVVLWEFKIEFIDLSSSTLHTSTHPIFFQSQNVCAKHAKTFILLTQVCCLNYVKSYFGFNSDIYFIQIYHTFCQTEWKKHPCHWIDSSTLTIFQFDVIGIFLVWLTWTVYMSKRRVNHKIAII